MRANITDQYGVIYCTSILIVRLLTYLFLVLPKCFLLPLFCFWTDFRFRKWKIEIRPAWISYALQVVNRSKNKRRVEIPFWDTENTLPSVLWRLTQNQILGCFIVVYPFCLPAARASYRHVSTGPKSVGGRGDGERRGSLSVPVRSRAFPARWANISPQSSFSFFDAGSKPCLRDDKRVAYWCRRSQRGECLQQNVYPILAEILYQGVNFLSHEMKASCFC